MPEWRQTVRRWHCAVTHSMSQLLRPEICCHHVRTGMWQEPRRRYWRPNAVSGENGSQTLNSDGPNGLTKSSSDDPCVLFYQPLCFIQLVDYMQHVQIVLIYAVYWTQYNMVSFEYENHSNLPTVVMCCGYLHTAFWLLILICAQFYVVSLVLTFCVIVYFRRQLDLLCNLWCWKICHDI